MMDAPCIPIPAVVSCSVMVTAKSMGIPATIQPGTSTTSVTCDPPQCVTQPSGSILSDQPQAYILLYGLGPDSKPVPIRVDKQGRVILAPQRKPK